MINFNNLILKPLIFSCLLLLSVTAFAQLADIKPQYLRCEYKVNPVTDVKNPRLSWELSSKTSNQIQTAYQIQVSSSEKLLAAGKADFWDSKPIKSNATNQVEYAGKPLASKNSCVWRVRSWDKNGKPGPWSVSAKWEMGLMNKNDWQAKWIGLDLNELGKGKEYHLRPAPFLRKEVEFNGTIKKARLYVTALGLFEFYINGKRIGNDYFTPGWTDYNKRVYYEVYDVTADLKSGKNAIGSVLSYGWYSGYLGYALLVGTPQVKDFYGNVPLLKAQIEVEYTNGKKELIGTDASWKANHGPLVESDLLNGETYNAGLEFLGWNKPGFKDVSWQSAQIYPDKADRLLQVYPGNPMSVIRELSAKSVTSVPGGKYIIDLGQNFAGLVRLKVKGKAGDSIVIRYGEMLHPDGRLMTENLRRARATDTYILKGDPNGEIWMPQFTYHGFQYAEVSGFRNKPAPDAITGIVMSSATPLAGSFETDNKMINQLYHNIVWTQQSNYFDTPTDCPQRDERLGWTGDAQVYMKSASFNNDIAAFHTKWITDLNDAQWQDGSFPIYAPMPEKDGKPAIRLSDTYSPGWSEAGIICPYNIYKAYGDTRIIKKSWPYMVRYMDFLQTKSKGKYYFEELDFDDIKGGFGDWLSIGKQTSPDLLASMYYGYCAMLMAEMAEVTGKKDQALQYTRVLEKVKEGFLKHYTDKDGKFRANAAAYANGYGNASFDGHTQTAYANAIYMDMLPPQQITKAGDILTALIRANGNKLSTGFLGFKPLLPALSASGHSDIAYQLILSTAYPSLGFEVVNGANTIWERWNSYTKEKGFENNAGMNSFNHYAFGAVNEWMFGNMAGIKVDEAGYRTFTIKPEIAKEGINYVKASYHAINGKIVSSWKKEDKYLQMEVTVPVNTKAAIYVPAKAEKAVTGTGVNSSGEFKNGFMIYQVGSGTHIFRSEI